jgi:hypothetical protein
VFIPRDFFDTFSNFYYIQPHGTLAPGAGTKAYTPFYVNVPSFGTIFMIAPLSFPNGPPLLLQYRGALNADPAGGVGSRRMTKTSSRTRRQSRTPGSRRITMEELMMMMMMKRNSMEMSVLARMMSAT